MPEAMNLYIDVIVNQTPRGTFPLSLRQGQLWASTDVAQRIGLRLPAEANKQIALNELAGIVTRYDAENQRLYIDGDSAHLALPSTILGAQDTEYVPARSSPGALINYDLYGTRQSNHVNTLGLFSELRAFAGNTTFSSTGLSQTVRGLPDYNGTRSVRLDTSITTSLQKEMLSFTFGDVLTRSLAWTRPSRLGGVRFGRDFGLQPNRPFVPLPEFFGSATVPSDVELYVNGLKYYTGQVPAGPFQLNAMPGISSAGTAQIVLTDALGRSRTLDFSLYDSQSLLQQGLSDWSVELGKVREQYGNKSFSYGSELVGSGSIRYGFTQRFTAEAHLESTSGLVNGGVGAIWAPGSLGTVSASVAGSRHDENRGFQWSLGYDWAGTSFNFGASTLRANSAYRDVPSLYGAPTIREQMNVHAGYTHPTLGSTGVSYLKFRAQDMEQARYGSIYWFKSLGRRATLSLNFNQNLDEKRDRAVYVGLTIAIGDDITASIGAQRDRGENALTIDASKSVPTEGGWGWRVNSRTGNNQHGAQAQADYLSRYGQLTAGLLKTGDINQVYGGASGSVVLMGGGIYPSRRIDDGFAVVSTSGVANVPVMLENRLMGVTDSKGKLLVAPVHAYQHNKISIDTLALPADVHIDSGVRDSTPTLGAGNFESFEIRHVRAASVKLQWPDGSTLPVGAAVWLNGADQKTYVGFDGLAYLEGLKDENLLKISFEDVQSGQLNAGQQESTCRLRFNYAKQGRSVKPLGPFTCRR